MVEAMGDLSFLSDVVVLDLGDEATALAGEYLAELGATVVRVEDERGDVLRARGPLWNAVHNAGKRSVAIDTTTDDGWAPIEAMLAGVDVVIGPIEPNPATARFLDRLPTLGGERLGIVDVVFRRDARARAGDRPDRRGGRRVHGAERGDRGSAVAGRRRPRLEADGAGRRRGGAGIGHRRSGAPAGPATSSCRPRRPSS